MNAAKPNQQKGGSRLAPGLRLFLPCRSCRRVLYAAYDESWHDVRRYQIKKLWRNAGSCLSVLALDDYGFTLLVDAGLPEYTGEYLVAGYADRFPADVVQLAQERLEMHGVQLPH